MVLKRSGEMAIRDQEAGLSRSTTIETGLANIQASLDQMSESVRALLLFQQFATTETNELKNAREVVTGEMVVMDSKVD